MQTDTKKIGIIGFGEMGKRHGHDFITISKGAIDLAAVVEINDAKYAAGCQWTNCTPKRYQNARDMIANEKLDGIIIASPNSTHLDQLQNCARQKTPLLLEKPLETSLNKICDVVRFSRSYQGPIVVHHVMRYAPIVRAAREIIEQGMLGDICSANFTQYISAGAIWHNFRRTIKEGGGQLIEKATHDFDVMLYLVGKSPKRVSALAKRNVFGGNKPNNLHCSACPESAQCLYKAARNTAHLTEIKDINASDDLCVFAEEIDVPDNETCQIEFEQNAIGIYSHSFFTNGYTSREYQVVGTKGYMRIIFSQADQPSDQGRIIVRPGGNILKCNAMELKFNYYKRIHYNGAPGVVSHFSDVMNGTAQPCTTVAQAFVAELIGCAAYQSIAEQKSVLIRDIVPPDLQNVFLNTYPSEPQKDEPQK